MPGLMHPSLDAAKPEARVGEQLLARVLAPYKPHCRYLQTATVEYPRPSQSIATASGRFVIPDSCYIASTGHFNAVEFNICYNQLTYCLLARCIEDNALECFEGWTPEDFTRRQLSDFLIARFSSAFHKPLTGRTFDGRVEVVKVAFRREATFMRTICRFEDDHGGGADGGATIAIINSGGHHIDQRPFTGSANHEH